MGATIAKHFYVVEYCGDYYSGASLTEAFEAAFLEPNKTGYWTIYLSMDAGSARLKHGRQAGGWVEFTTNSDGEVNGGNR